MHLTREENEMLEGKYGYPVQRAMEILVGLGECYDAEKMLPVASAHLLSSIFDGGKAWDLFIKEMADKGGKFVVFTDTNPIGIDPLMWRDIGIPEELARDELALNNTFAQMGAHLCHTCTPYLVGNVPRMGEHVAWSESSAVIFANSVLGARTNREGAPSSLAAALTGRVPAYGYHLDQNRYGELKISVTAKLKDMHDYGTLGYFVGKVAEDRVPVLAGIPSSVSGSALRLLGSAMATSGSVALYHVVGVTPEAPTEEVAFGLRKAKDCPTIEFGDKELRETEEALSRAVAMEVDITIFGCPHASIDEIEYIAQLLRGRKLKSGVELWILTSQMVRTYAERMGYLDIIEAAKAKVLCDTCPSDWPKGILKERGCKTVATNSAKMTYYIEGGQGMLPHYGSTEKCIEAAISGIWR